MVEMGQKPPQLDGKIYRAAKPDEGFRWDTAYGAQRWAQVARQRRRYAQMPQTIVLVSRDEALQNTRASILEGVGYRTIKTGSLISPV